MVDRGEKTETGGSTDGGCYVSARDVDPRGVNF